MTRYKINAALLLEYGSISDEICGCIYDTNIDSAHLRHIQPMGRQMAQCHLN
jgi:hypothetical protein